MSSFIAFLLSQSVLLPLSIGLIRFRRLDKGYRPFLILLITGLLTEIISILLIKVFNTSNAPAVNIYTLLEWVIIAWQFNEWGFMAQKKQLYIGLVIVVCLVWFTENIIYGKINSIVPYFRFLYFFLIVLFSVNEINYMITHYNRNLFKNPKFLICITFIIYFIYMIVYFWAFQVSLFGKSEISNRVIFLMGYVNVFCNVIYAIALLLIPARVKFTLK